MLNKTECLHYLTHHYCLNKMKNILLILFVSVSIILKMYFSHIQYWFSIYQQVYGTVINSVSCISLSASFNLRRRELHNYLTVINANVGQRRTKTLISLPNFSSISTRTNVTVTFTTQKKRKHQLQLISTPKMVLPCVSKRFTFYLYMIEK